MTTTTTETSANRCEPLIIEQQPDGSKRITTIFHWIHSCGIPSHTLVRIQIAPDQQSAIAIISEIFTNEAEINRYANSIGHDLDTIATSVIHILSDELTVAPEQIRWIEHYGEITTNTIGFTIRSGPDTFMDVNLAWDGQGYQYSIDWERKMDAEEIPKVLGNLATEDLFQLLLRIGWTKLSQ